MFTQAPFGDMMCLPSREYDNNSISMGYRYSPFWLLGNRNMQLYAGDGVLFALVTSERWF